MGIEESSDTATLMATLKAAVQRFRDENGSEAVRDEIAAAALVSERPEMWTLLFDNDYNGVYDAAMTERLRRVEAENAARGALERCHGAKAKGHHLSPMFHVIGMTAHTIGHGPIWAKVFEADFPEALPFFEGVPDAYYPEHTLEDHNTIMAHLDRAEEKLQRKEAERDSAAV